MLTWNCENIKNNIYCLKDVIRNKLTADLVCLSEPNIFQHDLKEVLKQLDDEYCYHLNSDDLHDPELGLTRCRIVGGTLLLWAKQLDPYVSIHQPTNSSFTAMILRIPGVQVSIHVCLYMPTSGKENDFVSELTDLRICLEELNDTG